MQPASTAETRNALRVSLLIPCFNEEKTIAQSAASWLAQTRPLHQIIVVDDGSSDNTPAILAGLDKRITVVRTPSNTGNKSRAQQYGLQFVTGDIMIATDGDTMLEPRFVEEIIKEFDDPHVAAAGGYVRSLKYNWVTRCRAFDYATGQNIHKLAQSYLGFMFVIPGAAGAFRTDVFRRYLTFDHDTITEDLDFTYKLHQAGFRIAYNRKAIVFTQDPATLSSYSNQMRRWFGGGWQNLIKHGDIAGRPARALELSLMYAEGLGFSLVLLILPILNPYLALILVAPYLMVQFCFAIFAAWRERRADLLIAPFGYLILMTINAYIFLEQFFKEVVLGRHNLVWFKPERVTIT